QDGDIAVRGQRDGRALASHSAGANQLIALLRPDTGAAGEHPRRPGGAKAKGYRSIPRVVSRPAHDCSITVGGQRDGHALTGASHSVVAAELLALLRPATAASGEHPCRPGLAVIEPPAHDGSIAVGGKCDRHALAGLSHSTGADEFLALLRPSTAAAPEHPRPPGLPPTHTGTVPVARTRTCTALAQRQR